MEKLDIKIQKWPLRKQFCEAVTKISVANSENLKQGSLIKKKFRNNRKIPEHLENPNFVSGIGGDLEDLKECRDTFLYGL